MRTELKLFFLCCVLVVSGCDEDHHHHEETTGPSIRILSSVRAGRGSPLLLVCVISGLRPADQEVRWWIDDAVVTSPRAAITWAESEEGGAYSAAAVWEVTKWRPGSTLWCGTETREGQIYRKKVCWETEGLWFDSHTDE